MRLPVTATRYAADRTDAPRLSAMDVVAIGTIAGAGIEPV